MINRSRSHILTCLRTLALVFALILVAGAGTAAGAASTVRVSVPHAKVNGSYRIKVKGFAVGRKHLYLFVEARKCGANPAAEFARSGANGTASGYYVPTAAGRFTVTMGFRTSVGISDHACAYLTNSSAPKNGKKGVVAHAFKTFKVVRPTEARRASANARAALATGQPPVCYQVFPDAHSTTIGRTTWYNRQRSVQYVVCDGFSRNPSADFNTDGVACGLASVAIGVASNDIGAFVDGACSGVALASRPKAPETYVGIACSWAADLLDKTPAALVGVAGGMGCALAPAIGHALGGLFESGHELDVARDIMLRGKCLKYSPTHFGSPWLAVDCASSDAGFSTLPRVDNRPSAGPAPGGGPSPGSGPVPSGNPNSTGGSPALPPHEFSVMNASGGIYWRSAPDWNAPEAVPGNGFYPGTIILVSCYQSGAANVPGSADSVWEQASWVAGPGTGHGWINEHFIADGSGINQPSPGIPPCSSSPPPSTPSPAPPPPAPVPAGSTPETAGGVTHTWTNYSNAGGTQGPSIQTGQTVGVACKMQGFRVADGDTWWYKIASSPWNGTLLRLRGRVLQQRADLRQPHRHAVRRHQRPRLRVPHHCRRHRRRLMPRTSGGVTHTWTNYTNAGGTQGPSIQTGQTVGSLARCRASGSLTETPGGTGSRPVHGTAAITPPRTRSTTMGRPQAASSARRSSTTTSRTVDVRKSGNHPAPAQAIQLRR